MSRVPEGLSELARLQVRSQVIEATISRAEGVFARIDKPGFFEKDKERGKLRLDNRIEDPAQFIDNVLRVGLIKKTLRDVSIPRFSGDLVKVQEEIIQKQHEEDKLKEASEQRNAIKVDFPTADQIPELTLAEKMVYEQLRKAGIDGTLLSKEELDREVYGMHPSASQRGISASSIVFLRRKLPTHNLEISEGLKDVEGRELYKLVLKQVAKEPQFEPEAPRELVVDVLAEAGVGVETVNEVVVVQGESEETEGSESVDVVESAPLIVTDSVDEGVSQPSEREEQKKRDEKRKVRYFRGQIWSLLNEIQSKAIPKEMNTNQFCNFAREKMGKKIKPEEVDRWVRQGYLIISRGIAPQTRRFDWANLARAIFYKRERGNLEPDLNLFIDVSKTTFQDWEAEQARKVGQK